MRFCKASLFVLMTVTAFFTQAGVASNDAQAGPLMDWLRSRCNRNKQTAYYQPQAAAGCTTCTQTCQRVVANYVPYTAYRTCYEQVPVTYYQRTTSTDPCTGCQITCNKPCTTYRMQAKRVPYTAYRTVYRTQTYTTPVTTNYAPSPCNTCSTCPAPTGGCSTGTCGTMPYAAAPTAAPGGYQTVSPATYTPIQPYQAQPSYGSTGGLSTSPADSQPSLTPGEFSESNVTNYPTPADPGERRESRSVIKDLEDDYRDYLDDKNFDLGNPGGESNASSSSYRRPSSAMRIRGMQPTQSQSRGRTASAAPVQQNWNYSPRLASYRAEDYRSSDYRDIRSNNVRSNDGFQSQARGSSNYRSTGRQVNQGWNSGN